MAEAMSSHWGSGCLPATITLTRPRLRRQRVGDTQQGVGVRRQIDADDGGLLGEHVVDEPRVLVGEAVVVLPPDVGGEQIVERGDRAPPGDVPAHVQPLGVLVEHGRDDVDERLVAGEEAVAPGEEIALDPALDGVLAQDLHDPAVGRQPVVAGQRSAPSRCGESRPARRPGGWRRVSSGPKTRKFLVSRLRRMVSARNPPMTLVDSADRDSRARARRRRSRGSRAAPGRRQHAAVGVRVVAHAPRRPWAPVRPARDAERPASSNSSSGL